MQSLFLIWFAFSLDRITWEREIFLTDIHIYERFQSAKCELDRKEQHLVINHTRHRINDPQS